MIQPAYKYSCNWKYQYSYGKTRVDVFGECAVTHYKNVEVGQWQIGPNHIHEKSEHVNLGVFKNYCGLLIKILMRTSLRPERKQGCYSLLILTGEE